MTAATGDTPPVIDAHVHFWDPRELSYPWLAGAAQLNRPHLPDEFAQASPEPREVIFVEAGRAAHQAEAEVSWIRRAASTRPWIRGVVAHADLEDPAGAADVVRRYAADPFVVGVRRNLQDEPAGFVASPGLRAGVRLLGDHTLPFDACVRAWQLGELSDLADACPHTTIVLDHLGKPAPGDPGAADWRAAINSLARRENVVCKLSGLATEAAPGTPGRELAGLLRDALDAFGPDRCMYGSDWPVMTLATTYPAWSGLVHEALERFGADADATEAVLSGTATRVYAPAREGAAASRPL